MNFIDKFFEKKARNVAQLSNRRGFIKGIAASLVGASTIPLLPVARAADAPVLPQEAGDPSSCDYWRYCAIDGFLCHPSRG